jgi:spoIIIJ-associated protein
MTDKFTTLEVIAPSVEEAIQKGLADLGIRRDAVDVEILDEGARGFFGLGNRDARVRLTVKDLSSPEEPDQDLAEISRPAAGTAPRTSTAAVPSAMPSEDWEEDNSLAITRETVSELLEKMDIRAQVSAKYVEDEDGRGSQPIFVDIRGEDLSILIGSKAATLDALQYITRLIVSKELGKSTLVLVDVEGYRERRKRQLQRLARKMAEQALATGRRQVLEPMPANERRIIHIELRDHPDVTTESMGEEPRRKVTVIPRI